MSRTRAAVTALRSLVGPLVRERTALGSGRHAMVVMAACCLAACGGRSRMHASAPERMAAAQQVAVIAGAGLLERTSDGTRRRDDWSDVAIDALLDGARSGFERRGLTVVPVDSGPDERALLGRLAPVIDAVSDGAYMFGSVRVLDQGDYVVSGVEPLLDRFRADLLFVAIATSEVVRWKILGGSSIARTGVLLALVDRGGRVVWYDSLPPGNVDIRKPEALRRIITSMLDELPARSGPVAGTP